MYVKDLISVIIPIYNMEMYLGRCLDSILCNTYHKMEIICVNDGSIDSSLDIIKEYCDKDTRIIFIDKENGGVSSARNAGLDCANGEYISFIDPDDWIDSHYFEYLLKAIKNNNSDIALCRHRKTSDELFSNSASAFSSSPLSVYLYLSVHDFKSYVWGRLYKHTLIADIRFDEKAKIEDVLFNFSVIVTHMESLIVLVDLPLYVYYTRAGSLVSKIDEEALLQLIDSYSLLYQRTTSEILKSALAEEMVKRGLAARYTYILKKDAAHIKKCNGVIRTALTQRISKRLMYQAMYYFSEIYRRYRISKDKTLLIYEKNIKEHRLQA